MIATAWKLVGPDTPRDRPILIKDSEGLAVEVEFTPIRQFGMETFVSLFDCPDFGKTYFPYATHWAEIPE